MIKIIKPGKKEFIGICSRCGCEFSYELRDLFYGSFVRCPDCYHEYYHPFQGQDFNSCTDTTLSSIPKTDPYTGNYEETTGTIHGHQVSLCND